ncbi:hypothetical protein LZD60_08200 [Clostridium perfringens]|nr:hypothetical protein LZD60_08200 [Clostridium perfringens]
MKRNLIMNLQLFGLGGASRPFLMQMVEQVMAVLELLLVVKELLVFLLVKE